MHIDPRNCPRDIGEAECICGWHTRMEAKDAAAVQMAEAIKTLLAEYCAEATSRRYVPIRLDVFEARVEVIDAQDALAAWRAVVEAK